MERERCGSPRRTIKDDPNAFREATKNSLATASQPEIPQLQSMLVSVRDAASWASHDVPVFHPLLLPRTDQPHTVNGKTRSRESLRLRYPPSLTWLPWRER